LIIEGYFLNGRIQHGRVRQIFSNGNYQDAEMLNGIMHGFGVTYIDKVKYEGQWKMGRRHGQGILSLENGDKYEGEFYHNKKHGEGKFTNANGKEKNGIWINN
jgi:hypothetical protein